MNTQQLVKNNFDNNPILCHVMTAWLPFTTSETFFGWPILSNSIVEAVLYRWSSYSGTMIVKAPWRLTVLQGMLVRNFDVRFLQLPWNFTALCWHLSLQDNRLVVFANYYDSISGRRSSQHDSMADIYISSHLVSMMVYIVVGIHWSLWIDQIDRMPFIIVMIVDCYIYNSCSIIIWGIWIDIFLLY